MAVHRLARHRCRRQRPPVQREPVPGPYAHLLGGLRGQHRRAVRDPPGLGRQRRAGPDPEGGQRGGPLSGAVARAVARRGLGRTDPQRLGRPDARHPGPCAPGPLADVRVGERHVVTAVGGRGEREAVGGQCGDRRGVLPAQARRQPGQQPHQHGDQHDDGAHQGEPALGESQVSPGDEHGVWAILPRGAGPGARRLPPTVAGEGGIGHRAGECFAGIERPGPYSTFRLMPVRPRAPSLEEL